MTSRHILIGCDNAAVILKQTLIDHIASLGGDIEDLGVENEKDNTYYPLVAQRLCQRIIDSNYQDVGILLCGTGIGMAMTANKFPGIFAAVCHDSYSAQRAKLSNNGNVLCMGARVIGPELAKLIADQWLDLEFQDGSSTPKVATMQAIDRRNRSCPI